MMSAHATSIKTYTLVYIALLVLMVATIGASMVHTGPFHVVIALGIASVKALLILAYFMHVKGGSRWVILFFGLSIYMLVVGAVLTFADYVFRA